MKKLIALALALMMVMSLATTAFAVDITINNSPSDHTYAAYQIFSGTISDNKLVDIEWGSDVNAEALLAALQQMTFVIDGKEEAIFANCTTAGGVADVLGLNIVSDTADMDRIADVIAKYTTNPSATTANDKITGLDAGYYLIKDKGTTEDNENDVVSDFLVELTDDELVVTFKGEPPTSEKKVKDTNDSVTVVPTDYATGKQNWQDSADYDIGDLVPFLLVANLPSADTYEDYDTYKVTFHDHMDDGFTIAQTTIQVFVGTRTAEGVYSYDNNQPISDEYYNVHLNCADGCTFGVEIPDTKLIADAGQSIFVTFQATLNDNAKYGKQGNLNKSYITYSNNPNGEGEGKTPEDTVVVFTYRVIVDKFYVDNNGDNKPLAGATFALQKFIKSEDGTDELLIAENETIKGTWTTKKVTVTEAGTQFDFTGLDDGWYRLQETVAPEGYNKIDDIYFLVSAEHTVLFATFNENEVLTSLAGGNVNDGKLAPVVLDFTSVLDHDDSYLNVGVENKSGTTLPETGGMGTTLIYTLGTIMVIGAAVLLVTKKRMGAEN